MVVMVGKKSSNVGKIQPKKSLRIWHVKYTDMFVGRMFYYN